MQAKRQRQSTLRKEFFHCCWFLFLASIIFCLSFVMHRTQIACWETEETLDYHWYSYVWTVNAFGKGTVSKAKTDTESHHVYWIAFQNAALLGDENCIELRDRSHLCYNSIINYDLEITNNLVVSPQIRYIEIFDTTNPLFKQIWPVASDFVKSRFHCSSLVRAYFHFPPSSCWPLRLCAPFIGF